MQARIERLLRERAVSRKAFNDVVATCEASIRDSKRLIRQIEKLKEHIAFDAGYDTGYQSGREDVMHENGMCDCAPENSVVVYATPLKEEEIEKLAAEAAGK